MRKTKAMTIDIQSKYSLGLEVSEKVKDYFHTALSIYSKDGSICIIQGNDESQQEIELGKIKTSESEQFLEKLNNLLKEYIE